MKTMDATTQKLKNIAIVGLLAIFSLTNVTTVSARVNDDYLHAHGRSYIDHKPNQSKWVPNFRKGRVLNWQARTFSNRHFRIH